MSVHHSAEEEEDKRDNIVVIGSGPEPHAFEKPRSEAARPECNGTSDTGHRAASTTCFNFPYYKSQRVKDSVDERNPPSVSEESPPAKQKKREWVWLGLCYVLLSCVFFSVTSLLVKKVKGIHALEISGIRCLFQCLFTWPAIIYSELDLLGPKGRRVLVFMRGIFGSTAMMLLFYAIQQMPLADATVIMFSNPVFVTIFAWIFLKERCSWWDPIFIVFTLTGVILIARPPFIFGSLVSGVEVDYKNRIKGTTAAFASAICAALTLIVIRKMGKSVSYIISIWYYSLIGLIMSVIVVSAIQEWSLPFCGMDRAFLILIAICGIGGQVFLTKALQIEKAGPVSLMKTTEVLLAFLFQYLFLNYTPSWWSLGGALCVTVGTTGVAIRKWCNQKGQGKQSLRGLRSTAEI
ncbi:solute carrier family 35 member G1 [Carcharodon carcharias]|uniref:solute carrier family 35 member G1 n=1 Tax=Carcharodon carcharias TaxID=13397 RepID=UPI001B7DFCF0|nr:solute carrier family 35 member G1 [Carcharodon carcharias]